MSKYYKYDTGKANILDKEKSIRQYVGYMLARLQTMFKYENLPDTIPQDMLELYLQTNGHCVVAKVEDKLYAFTGGLGGEPDAYYRPTIYTVANPYLKFNANLKIDEDCILVKNDSLLMGMLPMFERYATLLTENDITMRTADINLRLVNLISASDDKTKASAVEYLKQVEGGNLGVVGENTFLGGIKLQNATGSLANYLTQLIELQQYLKSNWYNDLGLQSNYNMKREALNSSETQMNEDVLLPLIDDMLANRQKAVDKINEMFGTEITVDFNGVWKYNIEEMQIEQEMLEQQVVENETETVDDTETVEEKQDDDEEPNGTDDVEETDDVDTTTEEVESKEVEVTVEVNVDTETNDEEEQEETDDEQET